MVVPLPLISSSFSSPNIIFTYIGQNGLAGNLNYVVSGSTTTYFSGGANTEAFVLETLVEGEMLNSAGPTGSNGTLLSGSANNYRWQIVSNNQNNGTGIISSNTTAGSPIISLDSNYFKSGLIKNLLDRIIEIRSLIKNNSFYEIFNIKKISFLKDKTKIVCTKDIDIDYLNELKSESILLLECIDVPTDNYKEKAINQKNSIDINSDLSWTTVSNGTLTINPYVGFSNTITINDTNNAITYTTDSTAYNTFKTFSIKVVMSGSDTTDVPKVRDLRAIALPSGT